MPGPKARLRLDGADPINRGLLAFWPLQEPAGNAWRDISPNKWHASPGTAPTRRPSPKVGVAGNFDGATQYLTTAAPSHPGSTGAHSIAAWIRPNFSSASTTGQDIVIRISGVTWGQRLNWNGPSSGFYSDNLQSGAGAAFDMAGAVPTFAAGEWHFLVFTYNNGGQWYWDGQPVATNGPLFGSWPSANLSGIPFYIGGQSGGANWNGQLALIRQYTRPLTRTEIQRLYREPWAGTARRVQRAYSVASPNVTVALTGQSATFGQGTTGVARSQALTGQAGTFGQGALAPTTSLALTGQAITAGQGTITTGSAVTVALTGTAATFGQGTLTPGLSAALTGSAGTFGQGTITTGSAVTVALTGTAATFGQGSLGTARTRALTGQAATFAQGTITPSANVTLALTGQAATFGQGTIGIAGVLPNALTVSPVAYVTAGTATTIIKRVGFTNTDATTRSVTVYRVPSGGTASDGNTIISAYSLSGGQTFDARALRGMVLTPGATLQAKASTAGVILIETDTRTYP